MSAYTAQDQALKIAEAIKLIVPGCTVQNGQDSDTYPTLRISKNADAMYVKIESRGNASRIDGVGAPQIAYSPGRSRILQQATTGQVVLTIDITDWETGETLTPTINGASDSATAFDTDNDTSVDNLAADITAHAGFAPYVASAVSDGAGLLTITGQPGVQLSVTLTPAGGDSIAQARTVLAGPEFEMQEVVKALTVLLGNKVEIYSIAPGSFPASYSIAGALLVATIPSDKIHKLMLST